MENKSVTSNEVENLTADNDRSFFAASNDVSDAFFTLQKKYESNYEQLKKQEEMLSITSHELKSPITTIMLFLNLLEELTQKEENHLVLDLVLKAETQVNRLIKLVNNMQDITILQNGETAIKKDIFNFSALLNNTVESFRYQSQQHEIVIEGNVPIDIYADATRIEQVLVNLISNAVKYSPEKGLIKISVETGAGELSVSVQDSGIGIPASSLPHVFDCYFRAHQNDKRFKGTGLGLYISKQIINQHNGEIGVNSSEGKGSSFWFTLPLQAFVQL
jgi:signal transduction histidine kinase